MLPILEEDPFGIDYEDDDDGWGNFGENKD